MALQSSSQVVRRRIAQRKQQQRVKNQRRLVLGTSLLFGVIGVGVILIAVGAIGFIALYSYVARDLPSPESVLAARQQFETTLIYDRTGQTVLYQVIDPNQGDRRWTSIKDVPPDLIHATVAIEDRTFYDNPGYSVIGILRALWVTATGGRVEGGSSITQQLVKNTLIAPDQRAAPTLWRKSQEVILAAEISRRYSKDQILELYLNTNFYGNLAYGIDTASRVYFNKPVQNLTLGEAALLAAIPQNPSLNPFDNWQASRERQITVLNYMAAQGYITTDQAQQAASEPIVVAPQADHFDMIAPHFSLYARQQAEQLLTAKGLDGAALVARGGLHIYTTLDLDLQYQAECAARSYITRLSGGDPNASLSTSIGTPCAAAADLPASPGGFRIGVKRNVTNASLVAMRPATGEIMAMVGSLDYWNPGIDGNYNVAIGSRQPGSAFKIFTYTAALASGQFTPASMVLDVPTSFDAGNGIPYKPTNEDNAFHGPVSLRSAFANSYNIPAVTVLSQVGIGNVIRTAHLLGINTINDSLSQYGLSLALGSAEVSPLDLTYAYSVFANMGTMAGTPAQDARDGYRQLDPIAVLRIDDNSGQTLWKFDQTQPTFGTRSVISPGLAYLVNNILSDNAARVPAFGKGNALELDRPAAAKTGTTNDNRDAWTVGYTPQLAVGVWVGNNNNTPMEPDVIGITGAGPIWHALMTYYHQRDALPIQIWPRPATIVDATVCQVSGLLPNAVCPTEQEIFFADGAASTVPQQQDTYYKKLTIDTRNGLIATDSTPPDARADRLFFDYPLEARDWAKSQNLPLPPTGSDSSPTSVTPAPTGLTIASPAPLSAVHNKVSVTGTIAITNATSYTLAYGQGLNPTQWINITQNGKISTTGNIIPLGQWDTGGLDGLYTLRLQVTLTDQSIQAITSQVTVNNVAPTITILAPQTGTHFNGKSIALTAEASAHLPQGLSVTFYRVSSSGDQSIGTASQSPFTLNWTITSRISGDQTFYAIATDSAGNTTKSAPVTVVIDTP